MSTAKDFLELIQKSKKGKFKIYIGMSAGVGKTFRMLQEAHSLLRNGIDVRIGYIETHGREETLALVEGIPEIARKSVFYKGKSLEEMDVQTIINEHPEVVLVDELAHTNVEGSKNKKRWQDVLEILNNGINVISAMNIQHIESLNEEVRKITGVEVSERVPDKILALADEVVNIDLTADELLTRLKEGKIYKKEKIQTALNNFFQSGHILQLRELALKEVATHVERKVETEIKTENFKSIKFLACISSDDKIAKNIIRKTARLASYYNSPWTVLYVQKPSESLEKIALNKQRFLINNFNLAQELGAKVVRVKESSVHQGILDYVVQHNITTVCIGKPHAKLWQRISGYSWIYTLMNRLNEKQIDIIILS
ncbi:two-component system sensor histidine kinase KdpD [Chryseobacterium defluvii]|uniref:Two-component system sensor histidine kinase KdpD n=1 Tax=Chryseobacterium defluvii TaxID=160396 RepID=A0A840KLI5_9FLAO|nr:sensor protein KdpD [Chryseobacterium defluvii]MBB4807722.1 two-component system sensor histidine kinase KdpD [Chryseobacterium defluvii]